MAWYDDPELKRGAQALARMAFSLRFGGGSSTEGDDFADSVKRARDAKRSNANREPTRWTISWGKGSASYFDEEIEAMAFARELYQSGRKIRAISRTRGGLFGSCTEVIKFDKPKKLGGLWGLLED